MLKKKQIKKCIFIKNRRKEEEKGKKKNNRSTKDKKKLYEYFICYESLYNKCNIVVAFYLMS